MQEVSEIKSNRRAADITEENVVNSIFTKFKLPNNCEEDLQNFENALQSSVNFNKTVCMVRLYLYQDID